MTPGGRLAVAAVAGGVRQRAWTVLTLCAFLVLAASAAAGPMFAEAAGNAAFQVRRDQVPATARQNDAAVVRLSADAGPSSVDQREVIDELREVEGLTEPDLTGGSIGAELAKPRFWGSTVSAHGKTERARLFAVGDPAEELVAVGRATGNGGVWLPEPVAQELGAGPGDEIVLAVVTGNRGTPKRATAKVSGIYAVDLGGRLPADVRGGNRWALRTGDTPGDTEYRTLPAYLLIGDVATAERLATTVDDRLLWAVEAALVPGATLDEARRTAAGIEDKRRHFATVGPSNGDDPLALDFASGIGRIVATAQATTETVRVRTRPVEWAATGVGLASVLAVALLSARRRERELRHMAAVGMSPVTVGGLWLVENVLPAVVGAGLGWLAGWQLVGRFGPPGAIEESLRPAALTAAGATGAGLILVGLAGAAATARRVRPAPPATAKRSIPWGPVLIVVALVAAAGLAQADGVRGVDLLVPLLVLVAAGVLAGWVPALLGRGGGTIPPSSRVVVWLARRRLGSGGSERRLTVLVVTAGLGMLLFALSAVRSTDVSAEDRIAVASGAEAVAKLNGSWELDDQAPPPPPEVPNQLPPEGPVPGVRVPPLPPGNTAVWHLEITTPLDDGRRDLLAIDPARFRDVASWGSGPDLAAARAAVSSLAARPSDPDGTPRAIVVADPAADQVDLVRVSLGYNTQDLTIAERVSAFPGMRGRAMYVVAADPTFGQLGIDDPRLRPRSALGGNALFVQTFLWSSAGEPGVLAITQPKGLQPERISTAAQLREDAAYIATSRARGYQLAIAGYLALLAVLTLCVYAQRTAVLRRPSDLMLARIGLGPARVRRARSLEFVLLSALSLAFATAGVAALMPLGARLLDDQPGLFPAFSFQLSLPGLAITAGAAAVATILAVVVTAARSPGVEEEAYRDN
ncbi:FtsX-like permease family protein [Paractinoplanes brasiliensis]|uniref:Putative ABC transport system permease protein n=1 Tax=Paractinoplanes brasiliensis TaxID=52695 RepID=A0A4R6JSA5_9ACTN|nr:FtsX-like permease family protein [Actinoplanes brasiliensis]TDO38967.1 putative ABC transport system permease protein [Actinoplanes brasiliensis]GID33206.1 hypothetical protein Abr02nite_81890 [Actinoplanes brasiliensis]